MPSRSDQSSWLRGFLGLFPAVAEETTKSKQDLSEVERLVSAATTRGVLEREDLLAIESSNAWTYGPWWPRLGSLLDRPVAIGDGSTKEDRRLVEELHAILMHIEVVSVLLRFSLPERFGIYSPPVAWLLGLVPREDQTRTYLAYRDVLRKVGTLHGLNRVADVDMALWTAARPSTLPHHRTFRSQMDADARFQAIILQNFGEGLSRRPRWRAEHRLGLARGMMRHDPVSAGALAAPLFEHLLRKIASNLGIGTPRERREGFIRELSDRVDDHPGFRPLRGRCARLGKLRDLRNRAAHPPGLSHEQAREFVSGLEQLLQLLPALDP